MCKNARGDKFSAARVLTSEQCLAMIEEKERKKREDEEAKERRKAEKEEKRRLREEENRGKTKKGGMSSVATIHPRMSRIHSRMSLDILGYQGYPRTSQGG